MRRRWKCNSRDTTKRTWATYYCGAV